ncbi:MAG TPA: cation transporter dimerization domain-containing protein [Ktedonobacteraceae bacterium]|nr:cation transporter dimerization domain-containing protein [Ktedonobacteraceae bacterium]
MLDTALPPKDLTPLNTILAQYREQGITFHAMRTRRAGSRRFISFHVLVPGTWDVAQGHRLCEEIETAICKEYPHTTVFTHLEPREDPTSFADQALDRNALPMSTTEANGMHGKRT